jgi:glycerophosphoryl diester phosphodiesterase
MAPFIMAHRGDSGSRPENTLAAFAGAVEVGADLVEFDVQLTKDGHVIVIHDVTLDRTTNGKGNVREMTLPEIRRFSAGYPSRFASNFTGERVPTLAEALALLRDRARVVIEIKKESVTDDGESGIEALTVADVKKAGMAGDVALICFERRALLRCREHGPEIQRGHLFYRASPQEVLQGAEEAACQLVMPEKGMLSEELRDAARGVGIKVATWVVDDPGELRSLSRFNLYGVGTNRPGVLLDAIWDSE